MGAHDSTAIAYRLAQLMSQNGFAPGEAGAIGGLLQATTHRGPKSFFGSRDGV